MAQQATLPELDNPLQNTSYDNISIHNPTNLLVELLLKLERIKRDKEPAIVVMAARRLLDDSTYVKTKTKKTSNGVNVVTTYVTELLRDRYPNTKSKKTASSSDLFVLTDFERELFLKATNGELSFPQVVGVADEQWKNGLLDSIGADRVQHLFTMAYSDVEEALYNTERDEYVHAGGSDFDFEHKEPLHNYVLDRVKGKLSGSMKKADLALDIFIDSVIKGCSAKHDDVRSSLDRFVREGFDNEILCDIWERYPIEANKKELPKLTETQEQRTPATIVEPHIENNAPPERWMSATEASSIANRLTMVERDWSSYWKRFCENHDVKTRSGTTKAGGIHPNRRDVEIYSLIQAIFVATNANEFDKATPESIKRMQSIRAKLKAEFGIDEEMKEWGSKQA